MPSDSKTLEMIDCIYQAAYEPSHWFEFASQLNEAYEGAVVVIGMGLAGPARTHHYFAAGLPASIGPSLMAKFMTGLPFEPGQLSKVTDRFETLDKVMTDLVLADTDFFREWMQPHGFAPVWPICHVMTVRGEQAPAILNVFRKQGRGKFTPEELALGDDLVPHLARAFEIYEDLSVLHRSRRELDEVIDRLRVGVILTDASHRPVLMNRSARMIVKIGEIFGLKEGHICASKKPDDDLLQFALEEAARGKGWRAIRLGKDSASVQVLVTPLHPAQPGSQVREAVAALFISGPETFTGLSLRYVRSLYGLTAAETELVARLTGGDSLEAAAQGRGVALNTARTQLRRAFAKTDTRSQSDLVQLVLECVSSVDEA